MKIVIRTGATHAEMMSKIGITWIIRGVRTEVRAIEHARDLAYGEGYRIEFYETNESETPFKTLEQLPLPFPRSL